MMKKRLLLSFLFIFIIFIYGCAAKVSVPKENVQVEPQETVAEEIEKGIQEVAEEEILEKIIEENPPQVFWYFDTEWKSDGNPPSCPEPLVLQTPVDINLVTSILYPGQVRGGNYKAHGGFRFDNSKNNDIAVKAPLDGVLVRGSRYIEDGEIQYMFDIVNPCGIMVRFDHLLTLSPKFAEAAEQLRQPEVDDSRTTTIDPIPIKAGDVVATAVGFTKTGNVAVDWGVYDLRKKNDAAQNPTWLQEHGGEQAPYALCWLELLSSEDSTKAKSLPGGDSVNGKQSDYCK